MIKWHKTKVCGSNYLQNCDTTDELKTFNFIGKMCFIDYENNLGMSLQQSYKQFKKHLYRYNFSAKICVINVHRECSHPIFR